MGWWPLVRILLSVTLFFAGVIIGGILFQKYLPMLLRHGNRSFTITLLLTLCIGLLGEAAGLHMVIGAFLAGLFIREEVVDPDVYRRIEDRYFALTYGFFAPIFFASLAFHFDLTVFTESPARLAVFTLVAMATKVVGCGLEGWCPACPRGSPCSRESPSTPAARWN